MSELSLLRAEVGSALREFCEASEEPGRERLSTMAAALRFNNLKIAASEQAPRVCQGALGVCGIVGFKNDTPFSVGRHLRDTMSACLMVANERIHQTNAEPAADRQGRLGHGRVPAGDRPIRRRSSTSCVDAGLLIDERRARRLRPRRATSRTCAPAFDDAGHARGGRRRAPSALRFPPLLPRHQLEAIGYLKSFPHLAGTIFAFEGDEAEAHRAVASARAATRTGASSSR